MAKKHSPLDKGNKHPFAGGRILFATKHQKEKILSPLFQEIGLTLLSADIDSDALGTFSGERERKGTVLETLRKKIAMARAAFPLDRFFLASEGSFAPHPAAGFVPSDLETLLFFDANSQAEVYVEHLSSDVVQGEQEFGPGDDFRAFLKQIQFPSHAVIVRPADSFQPIFKGLQQESKVEAAMRTCFSASPKQRVIIGSDLRAHYNPTRQKVILDAGKKLMAALQSFCPSCQYPGYGMAEAIPGFVCLGCGMPIQVPKCYLFCCLKSKFEQAKPRPDGQLSTDLEHCAYCNP